jgi:hypothetical protein
MKEKKDQYPRVTEILKYFTTYDSVPKEIMAKASIRGTKVHAICAGLAKGAWIPDSMIPEDLQGYVNSFKLWSDAQVTQYEIVEQRYVHKGYRFTGQLDFVITANDGKRYLVDLKTSAKPQKTYPIQMAAYKILLANVGIYIEGAMLVYLNKDGEFPEIQLLDKMHEEMAVFMSALDCWQYFHKKKGDDPIELRREISVDEKISA